jgi:hypothetical protein
MSHDELEPIEALLRGQSLRKPSPELDSRIRAVQRKPARPRNRLAVAGVLAASLAVAAGLLAMVLLRGLPGGREEQAQAPPHPPEATGTAEGERAPAPIRIEQVWSSVAENEVVLPNDAPPAHRVRQQVVRHVRWIDERQHVQIEWNIPSEQTALVPLEYN